MNWRNDIAIFLQVIELFKLDVIKGKYQPGEKIPSVREYAQQLNVNPNTIVKVYDILSNLNLIESKSTNGYYLTNNTDMLNDLKPEMAKKYCTEFISQMESLGYSKDDAISYLREGV